MKEDSLGDGHSLIYDEAVWSKWYSNLVMPLKLIEMKFGHQSEVVNNVVQKELMIS